MLSFQAHDYVWQLAMPLLQSQHLRCDPRRHTFDDSFTRPAVQLSPIQTNYHGTTLYTASTAPHGRRVWHWNMRAKAPLQEHMISPWRQELMQRCASSPSRTPIPA